MRTSASSLLLTMLAGNAAALIGAIGACTTPTTITPTCTENVDQAGIHPGPDGCEEFAVCQVGDRTPAACCVDADGGALTGNDLNTCLYGYGGCAALVTTVSDAGNTTYICSSTYDGGGSGGGGSGSGDAGTD